MSLWPRRLLELINRHPRTFDALIAVAVAALTLTLTATLEPVGSEREAGVAAFALAATGSALVYWRRTRPLVVLPIVALITIAYWISDYAGSIEPVTWITFYSAARYGGRNRVVVWRVIGLALLLVLSVATIGVLVPSEDLTFFHLVAVVLVHCTASIGGEALYQRSRHVAELEHRATTLEADLHTQSALAAVEERTRIAREMHDIIAHGMSAIVVQSQAGQRLVDKNPDGARQVFETIEGIGRDSTNEMRRMLGVLRQDRDDAELAPQPTLDDSAALVDQAKDAGVAATLTVLGDKRPAPPGVELAGYRVIQEALTNVIRHAGRPVAAAVIVAYHELSVEISIVDDGLGAAARASSAGSGLGLLGMRERIEVYDGSFDAGPRLAGGYQVAVELPVPAQVSV